jgi:hypothetical protein
MVTFRRRNRRNERRIEPPVHNTEPTAGEQPGVPVLLSPSLVELAASLSQALGADFAVQTEGHGATGVMIVGPCGPAGIAFLRASHPRTVLLVIDRRWSVPRPAEAVIHLEAGADGYLARPLVAEVASQVRALARRSLPADHPAAVSAA